MGLAQVQAAARAIVADDGELALTVTALAAALGVRPPSLYKHIKSLAELKASLARQAWSELADQFARLARDGGDPRQLARAWWRYQADHPGICRLAQADWAAALPSVAAARARAEAQASRIFEGAGMSPEESEMAWRVMRSLIEGLAQQRRQALRPDEDLETTFSRGLGALVRGWRRPGEGSGRPALG